MVSVIQVREHRRYHSSRRQFDADRNKSTLRSVLWDAAACVGKTFIPPSCSPGDWLRSLYSNYFQNSRLPQSTPSDNPQMYFLPPLCWNHSIGKNDRNVLMHCSKKDSIALHRSVRLTLPLSHELLLLAGALQRQLQRTRLGSLRLAQFPLQIR